MAHSWLLKPGGDFHVFWLAGRRTLDGVLPYQAADGLYPFKYLPPVALFLAPLGLLPERLANGLWLVLSAVGLHRLVRWSQATLGGGPDARRELLLLLALLPFVTHLLGLGQSEGLLLWLMVESEDRRTRTPVLSGVLWAIACLFKPPFGVFLALVLWRRELRRGLGLLAGLDRLLRPARARARPLRRWGRSSTPGRHSSATLDAGGGLWRPEPEPGRAGLLAGLPRTGRPGLRGGGRARRRVPPRAGRSRRSPAAPGDHAGEAERLALALTFYATALFSPLGWRTNLLALAPALALLFARGRPPGPGGLPGAHGLCGSRSR